MTAVAKAVLRAVRFEGATPREVDGTNPFNVDFNPATLRVTLSNSFNADSGPGGGSSTTQFVQSASSSLSFELILDSTLGATEAQRDVRFKTILLAETFLKPGPPRPGDRGGLLPPHLCSFEWGTFRFVGMVESYSETLEFFSPLGVPMRAVVALTLKENRFQALRRPLPGAEPTDAAAPHAGSVLDAAAASGDSRDWRREAEARGVDNPRASLDANRAFRS